MKALYSTEQCHEKMIYRREFPQCLWFLHRICHSYTTNHQPTENTNARLIRLHGVCQPVKYIKKKRSKKKLKYFHRSISLEILFNFNNSRRKWVLHIVYVLCFINISLSLFKTLYTLAQHTISISNLRIKINN